MVDLDVRKRRIAFFVLLGVALSAFIVGIVVTVLALESATTWLVAMLAVMVVALALEILLFFWGESRAFDEKGEWHEWEAEARGGKEILLRCSACRETFTLLDTGERPLRHACPHCGRSGVLREPRPPAPAEG